MTNGRFKFRFYHLETEKMYEVKAICFEGRPTVTIRYNPAFKVPLDSGYLIQCTGLKDKNGKLVYEGDIVLREMFDGLYSTKRKMKKIPHEIVWLGCGFRAREMTNLGDYKYCEGRCENEFGNCEVIGNIHENPELLR